MQSFWVKGQAVSVHTPLNSAVKNVFPGSLSTGLGEGLKENKDLRQLKATKCHHTLRINGLYAYCKANRFLKLVKNILQSAGRYLLKREDRRITHL